MILLLACAPKPVEAPAPAAVTRAEAAAEPEAEPPPPSWWRSGVLAADDLVGSPSQRWALTLGGPVTEPVVGDDDRVYVVADGAVHCIGLDGGRKWTAKVGAKTAVERTAEGVIVGTDTALLWLDPATGATRRSEAVVSPVRHRPLALPDQVAWTTQDGAVRTVERAFSGLLSAGGRLAGDRGRIFAVSISGEVVGVDDGVASWSTRLGAPAVAGAAFDGQFLYVPFAGQEGSPGGVASLTPDGKLRWTWKSRFGPAAAVAVADEVIVPDRDGKVYALDRGDGHERWAAEGYGAFSTTPALVGRSAYVGNGDGNLYRIDRDDGGIAWKVDLGAPVTGDPTVLGGLVVAGLANGRVVALGG